jgi:hypothetical protein
VKTLALKKIQPFLVMHLGSLLLVSNVRFVPFSAVEISSSSVRSGSQVAVDLSNLTDCFGEITAEHCRQISKFKYSHANTRKFPLSSRSFYSWEQVLLASNGHPVGKQDHSTLTPLIYAKLAVIRQSNRESVKIRA